MIALWGTQGVRCLPLRSDLRFGAVRLEKVLRVVVTSDEDWQGRLHFDVHRHRLYMRLPFNYPPSMNFQNSS